MRLVDLKPEWVVVKGGKRIGFTFICPTDPKWRQSCFAEATPTKLQWRLFEQMYGELYMVQGCKPEIAWTIEGGIAAADFATMSVTPSLDGSQGGLWHGHITKGEIA